MEGVKKPTKIAKKVGMSIKSLGEKGRSRAIILDVGVDSTRESRVLSSVSDWVDEFRRGKGGKRLIFTPNPEMLVDAYEDERFREILNSSDLNIPDGVGLQLASRCLRLRNNIRQDQMISERVTGTDLTMKLLELASAHGYRVYLLGGSPGVADKVLKRYPRLAKIVADEGPAAGLDPADWRHESEEVIKRVNKLKPDLLFVGFGHKKQERWLMENKDRMQFGVGLGVGGAFDFISGRVKRAPVWVRGVGLEWLYRLIQEPWRWRRQLKLIKFFWLVWRNSDQGLVNAVFYFYISIKFGDRLV